MESTDYKYICSYEKVAQQISVCNEVSNMKSDSFQLDMEHFSHLTNKDHNFNSKNNLPRSLSKKGEEKKKRTRSDPSIDNERGAISSLKATGNMSETSIPVSTGTIDSHSHHQITINTATAATGTPSAKNKLVGKRSSSFKQTSIINPTRIVFFFATLSSIGTILLIYFTLSMTKYNGDKKLLDYGV